MPTASDVPTITTARVAPLADAVVTCSAAPLPPELATATRAGLADALSQALTALIRAERAERAILFVFGSAASQGLPIPVSLIDARDADGEPIADAMKRLPDVAVEAARCATEPGGSLRPWRAAGEAGQGAVLALPFAFGVGAQRSRGALVLQNRFVPDAFADGARIAAATLPLQALLRLGLYDRALESALAERDAARDEAARLQHESTKELIARAIHDLGSRRGGPFVPQNCTAIPPTLCESELFGHERGSLAGAVRAAEGLFRRAHLDTLFLDEIGDLPLELQAKLLRVLETGEVRPVGGTRSVRVDVRVVSATHRDLGDLIARGLFREDLYDRLNVSRIEVPPLRDRPEDIPVLVRHFLALRAPPGCPPIGVDDEAMRALVRFGWPGNVRQLENEVSRAALLTDRERIGLDDLSPELMATTGHSAAGSSDRGSREDPLAVLGLDQGLLQGSRRPPRIPGPAERHGQGQQQERGRPGARPLSRRPEPEAQATGPLGR